MICSQWETMNWTKQIDTSSSVIIEHHACIASSPSFRIYFLCPWAIITISNNLPSIASSFFCFNKSASNGLAAVCLSVSPSTSQSSWTIYFLHAFKYNFESSNFIKYYSLFLFIINLLGCIVLTLSLSQSKCKCRK